MPKAAGEKKEKKAGKAKDKEAKPKKDAAGAKPKKAKAAAAPADAAPPAPAAAAPPPQPPQQPFPYGGGMGLYHPRVGPFAPPSGGSYFSGGALGSGASIYGGGGGGGHPYLRHTAAGGFSPLLGPRMPGSPGRSSFGGGGAGALGASAHGAEALMGMGSNAIALAQAFQTRMAALSSVAASLLSKREAMVHQLARVQSRMGEVAAAREAIESETLADMEAVLHRLRAAEAGKFAVLQKDADVLMSDITSTDAFYAALTSFHPSAGGAQQQQQQQHGGSHAQPPPAPDSAALYDPSTALQFMRAYPELCAEADRLSVKPLRTDVDVSPDDFEREVANRNELASRYAALVDLVAAKDRIILQLLKEREAGAGERENARGAFERVAAGRIASVERQKAEEVEHWVHLADKLTGELNQVAEKLMRVHMGSSGEGGEEGGGSGASAASAAAAGAASALAARVAGLSASRGSGSGSAAAGGGAARAAAAGIALGGSSSAGSGGGGSRRASIALPPALPQHVVEVEGIVGQQGQQQHAAYASASGEE